MSISKLEVIKSCKGHSRKVGIGVKMFVSQINISFDSLWLKLTMDSLQNLQEFIRSKNNYSNFVNCSDVPSICKSEPCMLGVDEAGRGPVLGPMVYGVAYCPLSQNSVLQVLGCADSKALTEVKRDEIFTKMLTDEDSLNKVGWAAEVISPNYISNSMYKRAKHSLNEVSMNSAIDLIKGVASRGVNIAEVYVDTVGPPEKYQAKLAEIFPDYKITVRHYFCYLYSYSPIAGHEPVLTRRLVRPVTTLAKCELTDFTHHDNYLEKSQVAKKADSIYPIVSAASIVAKVTRDHALKVWQFSEGLVMDHTEFGSGYPGDPLTKKFIRDQIDSVFGYPLLVRFSWSTAELMLQEKAATCTFEDIDDQGATKKPTKSISSFFTPKVESEKKVRKPHKFFEERYLSVCNAFD